MNRRDRRERVDVRRSDHGKAVLVAVASILGENSLGLLLGHLVHSSRVAQYCGTPLGKAVAEDARCSRGSRCGAHHEFILVDGFAAGQVI